MTATTKYSREELRTLMKSRGLSQRDIAQRLGVSRQLVGETLRGMIESNTTRYAVCDVIGVDHRDVEWDA